jgi:hypothetical protein
VQILAGGGHGASSRAAAKGAVAYGDEFFDGDLKLYTSVSYYSDAGAELTADSRKIVGALPAPEPDTTSAFILSVDSTDWNSRDWWLTSTGNVKLFDQLTLDWIVEFERDYRQLATGGAILRGERPVVGADGKIASTSVAEEETAGNDAHPDGRPELAAPLPRRQTRPLHEGRTACASRSTRTPSGRSRRASPAHPRRGHRDRLERRAASTASA